MEAKTAHPRFYTQYWDTYYVLARTRPVYYLRAAQVPTRRPSQGCPARTLPTPHPPNVHARLTPQQLLSVFCTQTIPANSRCPAMCVTCPVASGPLLSRFPSRTLARRSVHRPPALLPPPTQTLPPWRRRRPPVAPPLPRPTSRALSASPTPRKAARARDWKSLQTLSRQQALPPAPAT